MADIPIQYSNRDCGHIHQSLEIKKNKLVNLDLCCLFHLFHKLKDELATLIKVGEATLYTC